MANHVGEVPASAVSSSNKNDLAAAPLSTKMMDDLCSSFAAATTEPSATFVLDLGYGFPTEARPRREKIAAIAKQVTNFLLWRHHQEKKANCTVSRLVMALRSEDAPLEAQLRERIQQLWHRELPIKSVLPADSIIFHAGTLESVLEVDGPDGEESSTAVEVLYLSPDAERVVSSSDRTTTRFWIVGGIIDRRVVQTGRSRERAQRLALPSARWPLDAAGSWHPREALNVDCILHALQEWMWTGDLVASTTQALEQHTRRHPGRPQHQPLKDD